MFPAIPQQDADLSDGELLLPHFDRGLCRYLALLPGDEAVNRPAERITDVPRGMTAAGGSVLRIDENGFHKVSASV